MAYEYPTCTYLEIFPRQIEDASDVVGLACTQHGIDEDEVWSWIDDEFRERFSIPENSHFGNVVTGIIFDCLKEALVRSGIDREHIDYYINGGLDTNFYIDGEEVA